MTCRHAAAFFMVVAMCGCDKGPTMALRFHPPAGAVYRYTLEQRTELSMKSGPLAAMGKQQLVMRMHFTQTVRGPAAGGGTAVEVVFDSTTMEMPGMAPERVANELSQMRGLRSTIVFDERAQILRTDFTPVPGTSPELGNQMAAGIKAMTFAFPEQPVGSGDSWTLTTLLPLGQVPGVNAVGAGPARTILTVREFRFTPSDTAVVLRVRTVFPTGPIQLEFGGQRATLKLSGELEGSQEFSLSRGAVVSAVLKGTMLMTITAAALEESLVMSSVSDNALFLMDQK